MQLPAHLSLLSRFEAGDTTAVFVRDERTGALGLTLFPAALETQLATAREKSTSGATGWSVESLVQLKVVGQPYAPFFAGGKTMRSSASVTALHFEGQRVEHSGDETVVVTTLAADFGFSCEHHLSWRAGEAFLLSKTVFTNTCERPLTLEMLSSFSIGGLSPFTPDDADRRLVLHRLASAWCAEGRLRSESLEALQLEVFHAAPVENSLRFGQVGSMPVRGHFPFIAVEDTAAASGDGVTWGVSLVLPGSWQLEVGRRDDKVSLSGGLADREFGHWMKVVAPGASFETPTAIIACVVGGLDAVCERLVTFQERESLAPAPIEADLPIAFNEWCSSWGNPTHDNLLALADRLLGTDVRYLVMDAGWYVGHGDWIEDPQKFPHGLAATAAAIRERGLIPGIWFEFENCESNSRAFHEETAHLLARDGAPLETTTRRFFDFRQEWTHEYFAERVIGLLRRTGIGYLKVDYNDTIGIGADGDDSLGEALRIHLEGVQRFWRRIRTDLPELVIENCASGGNRLEPSMMALSDQASFSDAHELASVPVIAANMHRAILPRKSQIWAVVRPADDERRLVYSLAATLLGRMCLSGDALAMTAAQWAVIERGCRFYRAAWPVIADGRTSRLGPDVTSYSHPTGWQAVLRSNDEAALLVCHRFDGAAPDLLNIELPETNDWRITATFAEAGATPSLGIGTVVVPLASAMSACAVLLQRA